MDEQTKQALLYAILAFNLVIIFFQVLFNGFPGIVIREFSWLRLFIGILVAGALGGGIFVVVRKR